MPITPRGSGLRVHQARMPSSTKDKRIKLRYRVIEEEEPLDGSVGGYAPATMSVDVTDVPKPHYFSYSDEILSNRLREDGYEVLEMTHTPSGGTIRVRSKGYQE